MSGNTFTDMFDKAALDAFYGTTNSVPRDEPPVTVESMLASIKAVMRDMPPAPPRIIESIYLVDRHEDWSRVRSHGRATRRRKQGKRQNIVVTETPKKDAYQIDGKVYVHPVTLRNAIRTHHANIGEKV